MLIALTTAEAQRPPVRIEKVEEQAKATVVIKRAVTVGEVAWNRTPPSQRREVVIVDRTGGSYTLRLVEFE